MAAHLDVADDAEIAMAALDASDGRLHCLAAGIVFSILLHVFILLPLLLTFDFAASSVDAPMEVWLGDETAGPPQPDAAQVPQQKAGAASAPAAMPIGALPSRERRDDLEIKLHALAKLRQPSVDTHLSEKHNGLSRFSAASSSAADAPFAMYAVRDFVRAQVERRWNPDLARLHGRNFDVFIRVEMTGVGVVTRAEIVNNAEFRADPAYRDAALSARNAVLLSSPFVLPTGHYDGAMDLTLSLSTRDALR